MYTISLEKSLLSVAETASLLGYSSSYVYMLIRTCQLKAYKAPGSRIWKIPAKAIEDFIHSRISAFNYRN